MNEDLKKVSEKTSEEENLEKEEISAEDEGNNATTIQEKFEQFKKIDSFKTNKKSFATGIGFYKLFWVFFIGCFVVRTESVQHPCFQILLDIGTASFQYLHTYYSESLTHVIFSYGIIVFTSFTSLARKCVQTEFSRNRSIEQ